MLRGNTVKVSHFGCLNPGILEGRPGVEKGFLGKVVMVSGKVAVLL
jgi:hypothetical protein